MRAELKKEFPTVKFSITSERSTVNVRWIDGPTEKQVECIVGKYRSAILTAWKIFMSMTGQRFLRTVRRCSVCFYQSGRVAGTY